MTARPRFSPVLETPHLTLPPQKKLGGIIAAAYAPSGDLFVLHQFNPPGVDLGKVNAEDHLPDVVRFSRQGEFIEAWGGPHHIPSVDGVSQWPAGREGLECDAEGNLWVFGFYAGDHAVLKLSPSGKLLLRIGEREKPGNDDDTRFLNRPTSCYHDVAAREVFVSDGYGNHRVIAFNSDTGEFTRMWGAYGKAPGSLSANEGFGNPVHKVARGPNGRIYVCDRINNRVQEFELVAGGARFLREVSIAPGTKMFGAAFDIGFSPDGNYIYVADGSNIRIWIVDPESFKVLGWASANTDTEGDVNLPRHYGIVHRFTVEPSGDLLLACTSRGLLRMKYLGIH